MEKTLTLNPQQVDFLETLLAQEYEQDENNPKSGTYRHIAHQLLEQLQNNE